MRKTVDTVAIDVEFFYLGHLAGERGGGGGGGSNAGRIGLIKKL